jgi:hypothetical protein
MKRSKGLTVVAVLLIVFGALGLQSAATLITSVTKAAAWEEQARRVAAAIDEQVDEQVRQGTLTAEQGAARRESARRLLEAWERIYDSLAQTAAAPLNRLLAIASLLLALAGIGAGVGLLLGRGWARPLTVGQAVGQLLVGWGSASQVAPMLETLGEALASLPMPLEGAARADYAQALQTAISALLWGSVGLAVAWNVFVVWFLTRRTVSGPVQR